MLTKTKMILAAVAMLGVASAAQASGDSDRNETGGQAQSWQDIEHSKQLVQQEAAGGPAAYALESAKHVKTKHHAN